MSKVQPAQTVNAHYEASLTLPYSVKCNGQNVPAGRYNVSVNSDGKTARLTLNAQGVPARRAVNLSGVSAAAAPGSKTGMRDEVLVSRNGEAHQLAELHVAQLRLVFDPTAKAPAAGVDSLTLTLRQN